MIEPNDFLGEEEFLRVTISDTYHKTYTLTLDQLGRERMLEFGIQLYEGIMSNHKIMIQRKGTFIPLLTEEIDRESFRITMADYFRLTRIF